MFFNIFQFYSWHTYNVIFVPGIQPVIRYLYTLWCDHANKPSAHLTPCIVTTTLPTVFPKLCLASAWLFHNYRFVLFISPPFHTASVAPLGFRLHCSRRLSGYECSGASFLLSLGIVQYSGKKRAFDLSSCLGLPAVPLTTMWHWGHCLTSGPPFLICYLE